MSAFALLILGIIGLWLGTEILVRAAINIAQYYQLSQIFIGLSILAIGTDLPELVVAINASIQTINGIESSGVIVGTAIGSGIGQISVALGVSGYFSYLIITKDQLKKEGVVLLGSIVLLFLFALDGRIDRIEGISMLLVYLIYYILLLGRQEKSDVKQKQPINIYYNILFLIGGILIVIFTSELVVDNGIQLAERLGVSQSFIGIVLIGLGTSLPELAVSLNAAIKGASGLSVGNIIGSNIFDILVPIGIGATITPIAVDFDLVKIDIPFLFVLSALVLLFFRKKKGLQKKEAVSLIIIYMHYVIFKIGTA